MAARTSSIPLYSEIARESFYELAGLEPRIKTLRDNLAHLESPNDKAQLEYEIMPLEIEAAKLASVTMIFTTISLEAYIYDYAARHFSDSYVKKYLDRLDPVSKWVIIPRLVTGKELKHGGKWLQLLKDLIRERNFVIHSKSSQPPSPSNREEVRKYIEKLEEDHHRMIGKARNAIELLDTLVAEIGALDPEEAIWAESYLSKPFPTLEEK